MNFDYDDEEFYNSKGSIVAKIVLILVGVIIIVISVISFKIYSFFTDLSERTYYILKVNDSNRIGIVALINQEGIKYCNSMYKIEFYYMFPDGSSYTIYCKDEKNISFEIDRVGIDTLERYIQNNGAMEKR